MSKSFKKYFSIGCSRVFVLSCAWEKMHFILEKLQPLWVCRSSILLHEISKAVLQKEQGLQIQTDSSYKTSLRAAMLRDMHKIQLHNINYRVFNHYWMKGTITCLHALNIIFLLTCSFMSRKYVLRNCVGKRHLYKPVI
jgi:hypothetical protein